MWLVGGNRASGFVLERGLFGAAAGADVVVVQELVMAGAEQDQIVQLGLATPLDCNQVMRFELASGVAAGVLALRRSLVQCALLRVRGAASDA